MAIFTTVAGNPQSCYTCAQQITTYAEGMETAAQGFSTAKSNSDSEWGGTAGDAFRESAGNMSGGATGIAEQARNASTAVSALGDGLASAKAQMRGAAEVAAAAGIEVQPNMCDPAWIMDPQRPVVMGPMTMADEAAFAVKQAAYTEALGMVITARTTEKDAHSGFAGVTNGITTAIDDTKRDKWWLVASGSAGYVGTAVQQANKWTKIADANSAKADQFRRFADEAIKSGDPFWESKALSPVRFYEGQVDDATKVVAANSKLVGGAIDNPLVRFVGASAAELPKIGPALGEFGSKVPLVGSGVTVLQTATELQDAKDKGDVVEIVGKNAGGLIAGTVATELLLASAAGGPATFAAVGLGIAVGWGTSEVIDHWDSIADWVPGI